MQSVVNAEARELRKITHMFRKHGNKIIVLAVLLLMIGGFLVSFSGIRFPFLDAKGNLNGHLKRDFGAPLPPSAKIERSYWVGSHDPENVFGIQMDAKDIDPFIDSIRAAAKARGYTETDTSFVAMFGPLYGAPSWWNSPPLGDGAKLEYTIPIQSALVADYRFLYSSSTGKLYLVWGTN